MSIEAWEKFHGGSGEVDTLGSVPGMIASSWIRSRRAGVPVRDLQVPHLGTDHHTRFMETAIPILLGVSDLLVGSSTSLALTDASGTVTWRWDSEPEISRGMEAAEVGPGSSLHETSSGTNGIAIASILRRPVTVVGAQHYKEAWHRWACAASPVLHPVTGELTGVLNVACLARDANQFLDVAARTMAREVHTALRAQATAPEQRLLAAHLKRRSTVSNPVVTLNAKTLIADDEGLRIGLDHAELWSMVCDTNTSGRVVSIAPGLHARVSPVLPGRNEAGFTVEIVRRDGGRDDGVTAAGPRSELEMAEMRVIRAALARHGGNKRAVAQELGISPGTLYNRIRRYGVAVPGPHDHGV